MIALLLFIIPLLMGLFIALTRIRFSFLLSVFVSFSGLLLSWFMLADKGTGLSLFDISWIPSLGIRIHLDGRGISGVLVLMTFLLYLLILIQQSSRKHDATFYGLALIMQTGLNGVFMARDALLFYVCWELALIPIFLICLIGGGENREKITLRFFLFTVIGSLFMLAGLLVLYIYSGDHFSERSFSHEVLMQTGRNLPGSLQIKVFVLIFLGFAVKIPILPFHVWQPDTYTNAPYAGTMLLSGLMAKMGTFGYLFWLIPTLPQGYEYWSPWVMSLSLATVLFASCVAMVQSDFKTLLAWSSMAHMGMMAAGITAVKPESLNGSVVMMFSHAFTATGLFMVADILDRHTGTTRMERLGGIRSMNGQFSNLFLIILLGSVALPLTSGFPGEFLILNGIYQYGKGWAIAAVLSVIFGAVYMLRSFQKIMLGEPATRDLTFQALNKKDKWVISVIAVAVILLGIFPNWILQEISGQIQGWLENR